MKKLWKRIGVMALTAALLAGTVVNVPTSIVKAQVQEPAYALNDDFNPTAVTCTVTPAAGTTVQMVVTDSGGVEKQRVNVDAQTATAAAACTTGDMVYIEVTTPASVSGSDASAPPVGEGLSALVERSTPRQIGSGPVPAINGELSVGSTLSVTLPAGWKVQWCQDGNAIAGAAAGSYTLADSDEGHGISCIFTGPFLGKGRAAAAGLVQPRPLPDLTGSVSIPSTANVGDTLTVNTAGVPEGARLNFSWPGGVSGSSYTVKEADAGKRISVTMTADGYKGSVISNECSVNVPAPKQISGTASISGDARYGGTLTVTASIQPADAALTYQWRLNKTPFGQPTNDPNYKVESKDAGGFIDVVVTASNYGGQVVAGGVDIAKNDPAPAPGGFRATSVTTNTVTLTVDAVSGRMVEYSVNQSGWQTSNVFNNLSPNTDYTFYARWVYSADKEQPASAAAITVRTREQAPPAPADFKAIEVTDTSVKLSVQGMDGRTPQYSKDGQNWQDSNEFTGLTPYTAYNFRARFKHNDGQEPGKEALLQVVTKQKSDMHRKAPDLFAAEVHDTYVVLDVRDKDHPTVEYSKDRSNWSKERKFTGLGTDSSYNFYARWKDDTANVATIEVKTKKSPMDAPSNFRAVKIEKNAVTLTVDGADTRSVEMSKDGKNWQIHPTFSDLSENTTYTFYARWQYDDKQYEASKQAVIKVTTGAAQQPAVTADGKLQEELKKQAELKKQEELKQQEALKKQEEQKKQAEQTNPTAQKQQTTQKKTDNTKPSGEKKEHGQETDVSKLDEVQKAAVSAVEELSSPQSPEAVAAVIAVSEAFDKMTEKQLSQLPASVLAQLAGYQQEAALYSRQSETGVTVTDEEEALPWHIGVEATQIDEAPGEEQVIEEAGDSKKVSVVSYDIKLCDLKDGTYYKLPDGSKVLVTIPMPDLKGYSEPVVYHIKDDGAIEYMEYTSEDGYLKFYAGSFSIYGVAAETAQDIVPVDTGAQPQEPEQKKGAGGTIFFVVIGLVILLCVAAIVIIVKRNENLKQQEARRRQKELRTPAHKARPTDRNKKS